MTGSIENDTGVDEVRMEYLRGKELKWLEVLKMAGTTVNTVKILIEDIAKYANI